MHSFAVTGSWGISYVSLLGPHPWLGRGVCMHSAATSGADRVFSVTVAVVFLQCVQ